jgi:hypothetical protein
VSLSGQFRGEFPRIFGVSATKARSSKCISLLALSRRENIGGDLILAAHQVGLGTVNEPVKRNIGKQRTPTLCCLAPRWSHGQSHDKTVVVLVINGKYSSKAIQPF